VGIFEEGFAVEAPVELRAPVALTAAQLDVLRAVLARLVPADEHGPGAVEAGVLRYVERGLAAEYAGHSAEYAAGLDALGPFAELEPERQDEILAELEGGAFFELVRRHALEGMFGDPAWGGNADRAGWQLLGYPGPQLVWSAAEQAIEPT
jgi:gluconate 2-dehydrogenase gamma chain